MTPTDPLTICALLFWIVLGGTIGGATAILIRVKVGNEGMLLDELSVRSGRLLYSVIFSSLIGSAAALAVQWLLIGIGKFRSSTSIEDIIFILAISVIAGYGGRRILPMIMSHLEKEMINTRKEVQETKKEMKKVGDAVEHVEEDLTDTKKKTELKVMESDLSARGLASLSPGVPHFEFHKIRNEMESYLNSHPTARRVAIILARMCKADNDLGKAIVVLDNFRNTLAS